MAAPTPIISDLRRAFTNVMTMSMSLVAGLAWRDFIQSMFEKDGLLASFGRHGLLMTAVTMTIAAVIVARLAGYATSPLATRPPTPPVVTRAAQE
jgi:hypothetical protein